MADLVFTLGDVVTRGWETRDSGGALSDAGDVTALITQPDATTATGSVTKSTTGTYALVFTPTQVGRHVLNWAATGANTNADSDVFHVRPTPYLGLVSLGEVKRFLGVESTATDADEDMLIDMIEAASLECEAFTGRVWARRSFTDVLDGGPVTLELSQCPVLSVTTVTEDGVAVPASGYTVSSAGILTRLTSTYSPALWAPGYRNVTVVYSAGAVETPADVRLGVMFMVRHFLASRGMGTVTFGPPDDYGAGSPFALARGRWEPHVMRRRFA